jgi:hypothetical protein
MSKKTPLVTASKAKAVKISTAKKTVPTVLNSKKSFVNPKFPVKRVSRTTMLRTIADTKGKIFTSVHIGKDGQPHLINGIRYKKQDHDMGYIQVYSTKAREMRLINPQTLTDLTFKGVHYKARK